MQYQFVTMLGPNGAGIHIEGDYQYRGEFKDDKMDGAGKFTFASGAIYEGSWQGGEYHGYGVFRWPDGRSYQVGVAPEGKSAQVHSIK